MKHLRSLWDAAVLAWKLMFGKPPEGHDFGGEQ